MNSSELKFRLAGRFNSPEIGKEAAEEVPGKGVCLLLDSSDPEVLEKLSNLRRACKAGSEEFNVIFCETSPCADSDYQSFASSDVNWRGKIKKQEIRDFLRQRHKILIGYSRGKVGAMDFLVRNSIADLKIGRVEKLGDLYDLEIFCRYTDADVFSEEVKKYLKIINGI